MKSQNRVLTSVQLDGVVIMKSYDHKISQLFGLFESANMPKMEDIESTIDVNNFVRWLGVFVVGKLSESSSSR